jgi:hypothetical protein
VTRAGHSAEPVDEVLDADPTVPIAVPVSPEDLRPAGTGTPPEPRSPGSPSGTRRGRGGGWLTRLAGADEEILRQAPADRPKFVSMGAVLVGTAAVAAVSAAFALNTAVKLSAVPATLVALLWGVVILNLDRMLIVSMPSTGGLRRGLVTAIPRILLAAVIGTIISMPLVLRIFQPEIDAELERMRLDKLNAAQVALNQDTRFVAIPDLEKEEAGLLDVASGQSRPDVASDPEVARLREAVAAKEKEYADAENALICERGGATCGSGVPGRGPIYEELATKLERLRGERDALRAQLAAATTAAQQRIDTGSQQEVSAAQADLQRVQNQLALLRNQKAEAENAIKQAEDGSDGLLARLQALERLSAGSWTMVAAHTALFLLFLCIEVLPVLVKVLSSAGPPSLYDQLLARREARSLSGDAHKSAEQQAALDEERRLREREEAQRTRIAEERAAVPAALEQHRAEMQIEAGKRANAQLAAKQEQLAQQAIDVWGRVAAARTDEELLRWYEQQTTAATRAGSSGAPAGLGAEDPKMRAMSYAEFMARRKATNGSTPRPAEPQRRDPGPDGIYRPADRTTSNGDHPDGPPPGDDAQNSGSWDAYEGDVAIPPPATPDRNAP